MTSFVQDAIDDGLADLRGEAEARMTSRVTIRRARPGRGPVSPFSGLETRLFDTLDVDVPFLLASSSVSGSTREVRVGNVDAQVALRDGHLPAGSVVAEGDYLDVTDGENAGTAWRVVDGDWADQRVSLRIPIVSTERPAEWEEPPP